jgi:hypothetical protein
MQCQMKQASVIISSAIGEVGGRVSVVIIEELGGGRRRIWSRTVRHLGQDVQSGMLDIDRWLMLFSFNVKLVGKIMRASWGFRVTPRMRPIDAIASGGKMLGGKSCLLKCNC